MWALPCRCRTTGSPLLQASHLAALVPYGLPCLYLHRTSDSPAPITPYPSRPFPIPPPPPAQTGPREVYLASIDALPLVQSPQVYGLHANADISYYTSATKALWLHLVDLQPRSAAAGSGVTREDFIAGVAKDIGGKLPEPFDLPLIKREIGIPSPTQVCGLWMHDTA